MYSISNANNRVNGHLGKMLIFSMDITRQCSKIFAIVFLAESIHLIRLVNKVLGQTNNMIHKSLKSLGFCQSPKLVGHGCNALVIIQCDFAFESFHSILAKETQGSLDLAMNSSSPFYLIIPQKNNKVNHL